MICSSSDSGFSSRYSCAYLAAILVISLSKTLYFSRFSFLALRVITGPVLKNLRFRVGIGADKVDTRLLKHLVLALLPLLFQTFFFLYEHTLDLRFALLLAGLAPAPEALLVGNPPVVPLFAPELELVGQRIRKQLPAPGLCVGSGVIQQTFANFAPLVTLRALE